MRKDGGSGLGEIVHPFTMDGKTNGEAVKGVTSNFNHGKQKRGGGYFRGVQYVTLIPRGSPRMEGDISIQYITTYNYRW